MKKTILIADDDPDIRLVVAAKLRQIGYETIVSEDGTDALAKMRAHRPDLVILDYFMPGMTGDVICREAKNDADLKLIPIIMISASMAALSAKAVRSIPCDSQMSKPFDILSLIDNIRLLLDKRG